MSSLVRIGDVCDLVKGGLNPQKSPDELFAHYSIPAFDDGKKPVTESGQDIKSQKTRISRGVVLVSKLNPRIPRVWFVDDEQSATRICSTEFVPFQPNTALLNPEYLAYALRHLLAGGQITGSTSAATKSRERAKPNEIANLRIPLPNLNEQLRIVDLLSRAEGIVRLRREAQAKAQAIIPALFLDMFGDPATNPADWDELPLNSLVEEFRYGTSNKSRGFGFPALRIPNVVGDRLNPADIKLVDVSQAEANRLRLLAGDLLIVRTNGNPDYVGRSTVFEPEYMSAAGFDGKNCIYASYLIRARLKTNLVRPSFLQSFLSSHEGRKRLREQARTSAGQYNINTEGLRSIRIPLPPLHDQMRFEAQCKSVLSIVTLQSSAVQKAEAAFQSFLGSVFNHSPEIASSRLEGITASP